MDEVLEKFEGLVGGGAPRTEFEELYKNWGRLGNQEERRKEILEVQKSNRYDKLDQFRGILQLVQEVEEGYYEPSNRVRYRPSIYVAGFHKSSPTYKDVLMLSEWLIEKPEDFTENWYVVPCPKGVRMIVVANRGITKCYSKFGQFRFETRTALPGGNPCEYKQSPCCVLDCFYDEKIKTMFVLDLLAWSNQPMTDGECEFRHYWLTSQFAERPALKTINKKNKLIFSILPKVPCAKDSLNEFMSKYPPFESHYPLVDGFLFYHKRAHYVSGETPLVGWLFPYMINEVLGEDITVNSAYLLGKPANYENQADFIQKFEAKMAKKSRGSRCRRSSVSSNMSVTDDENHNTAANTKTTDTVITNNTKKDKKEKIKAEPTLTKHSKNAEKDKMEAESPVTETNTNVEKQKMDLESPLMESSKVEEKAMEAETTENENLYKNEEVGAEPTVTETNTNAEKQKMEAESTLMESLKEEEKVMEAETTENESAENKLLAQQICENLLAN